MSKCHHLVCVVAVAVLGLGTLAGAAGPRTRVRPLHVLDWDLKGKQGAAPATSYRQVKALLMYAQPDVVALQNARGEAKAGGKDNSPLATLARSLGMYYAFAPATPGREIGCGLLSRYPIRSSSPLAAAGEASLAGLQAQIEYMRHLTSVILVRPEDAQSSNAAVAAVAALVAADRQGSYLVLGSWDAAADADAAVQAWTTAGLAEAGAALGKRTPATYPQAKPTERLDRVLVSQDLRPSLRTVEAVHHPTVRAVSDRLPLQVTLARAMARPSRERRPDRTPPD